MSRPPHKALPVQETTTPASEARADRWRIVLSLFTLYIVWGSTYLAIRIAVETIPPFLMGGVRFVVAGAVLYAYLRLRGAPSPTGRQWLGSFAVGSLLLFVGNGGVAYAEQKVASSLAAMLISTVPLWAALFAGLWGRWPNKMEGAGLAVGFAGIVLLNFEGNLRANPLGALILIVAAIAWAFGSVWSRRLPLPKGMMASAAEMLTGGGVQLCAGLLIGQHLTHPLSTRSVLAFLYLLVFGSFVAFTAYAFLLRRVRPALATSYAYVNPAVAVLLGVFAGGEHVGVKGVVALFVIVGGVGLVLLGHGGND